MDPDSVEWLASLRSEGRKQDRAHRRLHDLCVRAARTEVNRRRGRIRIAGPELEDLAEQAAADAMVAVIAKLETFRGERSVARSCRRPRRSRTCTPRS